MNVTFNTPPLLFFTFLKLYKWYQITQNITFVNIYSQGVDVFCGQQLNDILTIYPVNPFHATDL